MGKQYSALTEEHVSFIQDQKIYFVATAGAEGKINLSPKGLDTFQVISHNTVRWLNLTGSGNETAAHILENGRMTLMFCSFDSKPLILTLYGTAEFYGRDHEEWEQKFSGFDEYIGARQVFELKIDMVQTSCGFGVPLYTYDGQRDTLNDWAKKKGDEGIRAYWKEKNTNSLDGKSTGMNS